MESGVTCQFSNGSGDERRAPTFPKSNTRPHDSDRYKYTKCSGSLRVEALVEPLPKQHGALRVGVQHPETNRYVDGQKRRHTTIDGDLRLQRRVHGRVQHPPAVPELRVVVPHPLLPLVDHARAPPQLGARDEERAGVEHVQEVVDAACWAVGWLLS